MIKEILVKNFALIDKLELSIPPGFTAMTGETGAGKSILLGAMQLALGKRADTGQLKDPEKKSIIELTVLLEDDHKPFFEENELDFSRETTLRREILPGGKSRAFVNDTPVRLDQLKALSERLIDIHSQHDTLLLNSEEYQLFLLDEIAGNQQVRKEYKVRYLDLRDLEGQLEDLKRIDGEESDIEYLRFLVDELAEIHLEKGEEEQLEDELSRLGHMEELKESVGSATEGLKEEQLGLLSRSRQIIQALESASKFDHRFEDMVNRARSAEIEWVEISRELESILPELEDDPGRLQFIESRLSTIQNLKAKHRVSSADELLEKYEALQQRLSTLEGREDRLNALEKKIENSRLELSKAADTLHDSRKKAIPEFENGVSDLLTELSMPEARFSIELSRSMDFKPSGNDKITLAFSANKGVSPQPIHKVASGGELSRVMLSLKAILSRSRQLPTIVFDEIDTGVSGQAAGKIARILKDMGQNMQVLAITHLPQIASSGDHHIMVYKTSENDTSETRIRTLEKMERVEEVARLLSGEKLSEAALANARELLDPKGA